MAQVDAPAPADTVDASEATVDVADALRFAMRRVPSPVTVVTAPGGSIPEEPAPRGLTIGSFTSVSLEPALISFNVGRQSRMHAVLLAAPVYAVHILSDEQAGLSAHFALPGLHSDDQFADVAHRLDDAGVPILSDAVAVFHCVPHAAYPAGDHTIFVGRLVATTQGSAQQAPLLYLNRGYHRVGADVQVGRMPRVKRSSSGTP